MAVIFIFLYCYISVIFFVVFFNLLQSKRCKRMTAIFEKEQVQSLHRYIVQDDIKHVLFTKVSSQKDVVNICISDGFNICVKELEEDCLDTYVTDADCGSKESFFSIIRSSFATGDFSISPISESFIVRFGSGSLSFTLTLHPTTAAQRKELFQYIFFHLAGTVDSLNEQIKDLTDQVSDLKNSERIATGITSPGRLSPFEPDMKRNRQQAKRRPKKGSSLINPGSRKKKMATGVVFDDD